MNTQTFADRMQISRRTAAQWAQQGKAKAYKKDNAWIFEHGEPERLWHEERVSWFMKAGCGRDEAEVLAYLMSLPEDEREHARNILTKMLKAINNGADIEKMDRLIKERRFEVVGLDTMLEECMPSQA